MGNYEYTRRCSHGPHTGECAECEAMIAAYIRSSAARRAERLEGAWCASHRWSMIDRDGKRRCVECGVAEEHSSICTPQEVPMEEPTTLAEQFDSEMGKLTQDRGRAYGHPLDDFNIAGRIADAVASCPDAEVRHALRMIGVKMARLCTTPSHFDSALDIAGYARTILMIADERDRRETTD